MGYPTTFAGWKTFIRDFIDADDYTDTQVENFMNEGNIRLNNELDSPYTEKYVSYAWAASGIKTPVLTIAPDYSSIINVNVQYRKSLRSLAINEMMDLVASYYNGMTVISNDYAECYCVSEQQLYIFPIPADGTVIEFRYDLNVLPLSNTLDSNVFSLNHPEIYLYAACVAASVYMTEDERTAIWKSEYEAKRTAIDLQGNASKLGSSPLTRNFETLKKSNGWTTIT